VGATPAPVALHCSAVSALDHGLLIGAGCTFEFVVPTRCKTRGRLEVDLLPLAMQECRKIVGKTGDPQPGQFPAQHADVDVENYIYEQLVNAAGAVHDEVCRERIIAFEEAAANAPVVTPLSPVGPAVPTIGENLPAVPAVRGLTLDEDMRFEDVVEDGAKAARVHLERARIVTGQVAANASVQAQRIAKQTVEGIFVRPCPVVLPYLLWRCHAASFPQCLL
jgi:hypothetical protein